MPRTLDVQVARAVDHDLGDRFVEQEGVERPEATDLADQLLGQVLTLVMGHRVPVDGDDPVDDRIDLDPELFRIVDVEQRIERDHDFGLEAQPDLAQQVLAGRDRGRRRGHDRDRGGGTTISTVPSFSALARCCACSTLLSSDMDFDLPERERL